MDIKDFQGLFKFKLIVPTIYVLMVFAILEGPTYFPKVYDQMTLALIAFMVFKFGYLGMVMGYINLKAYQIRNKRMKAELGLLPQIIGNQEILFGFIIPNYKEDVEMLAETLQFLAVQKKASDRYCIFLAMQAHQQGSQLKAYNLIERFKDRFRAIDFTKHQIREFQQKGKASNVSWCAQHLQPIFQKHEIKAQNVMLTIMDADSWAPQMYFDQIDEYLAQNLKSKDLIIFQPPQIFTRNHLDVPVFTRVYDLINSYAHCTQLLSFTSTAFSLSNYTFSYNLVKRIGFWDTCPDAIGEDCHTVQKAFWKTQGQIFTVPIYVPFNQVNVKTDQGYWGDVKARFWQAQRHAQGMADLAYSLNQLLKSNFSFRSLALMYNLCQTVLIPSMIPWLTLTVGYQSNDLFLYFYSPQQIQNTALFYLVNSFTIVSILSYIQQEIFKRTSNSFIYHQKNESLWRIIQYLVVATFTLMLMSLPSLIIGAFKVLTKDREYKVAQKKGKTGKQMSI